MNRKANVNRYMCVEPAVVRGKILVATAEVCMHVTFAQRNVRTPTVNRANKLVLIQILTKFVGFKKKNEKVNLETKQTTSCLIQLFGFPLSVDHFHSLRCGNSIMSVRY